MRLSAAVEPLWSTADQWRLLLPLLLATALSSVIGLEREIRAKAAGLRTHTLVGLGTAVFTLVSRYGFGAGTAGVSVDPSRIAAQIVTGIGFIGGGLIFVRRDAVRGLTTAATIWVTAGVGMAAGAGLPLLAVAATAGHVVFMTTMRPVVRALNRRRQEPPELHLVYLEGHGLLRAALRACTDGGWSVKRVEVTQEDFAEGGGRIAWVTLHLGGPPDVTSLTEEIAQLPGIRSLRAGRDDAEE